MLINRLKDILKANINSQLENSKRFKEYFDELDFDFSEWKKSSDEYHEQEDTTQNQSKSQQQYYQSTFDKERQQELEYYKALEVPVGAPFAEIKKSYRRLMKVYHPDLFHNDKEKQEVAMEVSRKINEAYAYFEKKFGK